MIYKHPIYIELINYLFIYSINSTFLFCKQFGIKWKWLPQGNINIFVWNTHYNYLHPWSYYANHNKGKVYQHVQVVISNASNCKLMSRMIIVEYSNIMWNPCIVHCLDLMVDKIGKLNQLMEEVLNVARNMVTFVIKKPKVLTMYKMHGNLESQVFNHVLCYKHPRGDKKSNKNRWSKPSHER